MIFFYLFKGFKAANHLIFQSPNVESEEHSRNSTATANERKKQNEKKKN